MKSTSHILVSCTMLMLCWACRQPTASQRFPYTTADFKMPLRGIMEKMEQQNIVYLTNSGCRGGSLPARKPERFFNEFASAASIDDLKRASRCSNPTIRASALMELLVREANPIDLIKEHLSDTALVFDDYSERRWSVISFLVHHANRWESKNDRREAERLLLERRPFEEVSYDVMALTRHTDTFPGFYAITQKMVEHFYNRDAYTGLDWYHGMQAVERLASYRRAQDVSLLTQVLVDGVREGNSNFFPSAVIKQFPDTAFDKFYLDTSATWFRMFKFLRWYYQSEYNPYSFEGINAFIALVIEHKSAKSAMVLERILYQSPFEGVGYGGIQQLNTSTHELYEAIAKGIRENYCGHYTTLMNRTAKYANPNCQETGSHPHQIYYRKTETQTVPRFDQQENAEPYIAFWRQ